VRPAPRRLAALLLFPALLLAACGGSSSTGKGGTAAASNGASSGSSSAAQPSSAVTATTKSGLVVTGGFGDKPTVTVPATAEPTKLVVETLAQGKGPVVKKGETIVVNYLGQTWKPANGKTNVFDNSYDHNQSIGFEIGAGKVIKGWDQGLVGLDAGSRVVLSIPADLAYGATPPSGGQPAGALVFVVDVLGSVPGAAVASGTPVTSVPAGMPKVDSRSGQQPTITSVAAVKAPAKGQPGVSALLIKGSGAPIEEKKTLAVQIVQTDLATGKQTNKTFDGGGGPQVVPAAQVLAKISALKGATIGSRAVLVTAPTDQGGALAVVVDVVGQF